MVTVYDSESVMTLLVLKREKRKLTDKRVKKVMKKGLEM